MCEFYLARVNDNVFHFLFGMSVFKLWIFNKDRIVVILNLDLVILIFYLLAYRSTNINFKNAKSIFSIFTNLMDSIYYLTYLKYFWVLLRYIQSSLKFCKSFIIHQIISVDHLYGSYICVAQLIIFAILVFEVFIVVQSIDSKISKISIQ